MGKKSRADLRSFRDVFWFAPMNDAAMPEHLFVKSGPLELRVRPALAARVTELLYAGRNLLATPEVHPDNWGATYWTSPQADWGWPPVPEVDHLPYEPVESDSAHPARSFALRSRPARIGPRRFVIEKRFAACEHPGVLDAEYTIENVGRESFFMANWEISRVPAGGLTFYPTGSREISPIAPHAFMPTEKSVGTTFYDHASFSGDRCLKLHADGTGGYLAHLANDLLVVKIFEDTVPEEQAPGEGECEIFANEDGKYVEIEVQGPYRCLASGQRLTTRVRTGVAPLPEGLGRANRAGLRAFADELRAKWAW